MTTYSKPHQLKITQTLFDRLTKAMIEADEALIAFLPSAPTIDSIYLWRLFTAITSGPSGMQFTCAERKLVIHPSLSVNDFYGQGLNDRSIGSALLAASHHFTTLR